MKTLLLIAALVFPLAVLAKPSPVYQPGDADLSGTVCMADSILIIYHLWRDGRELPCRETADVDRDGNVSVVDVVAGLRFVFFGDEIPDCPITCSPEGYYPE
jgi:hypothetical protein